ncbi:cobaltochelatase subunit CobN [Candidatus Methanomassiliicoccus intestinalis]|uniref:cobaltochelatase subunit CobN n=2 Tax=Candidatus Methanomassiliicoccus intestinalis TaxID=1406512 RepID=UPI0037DD9BF4
MSFNKIKLMAIMWDSHEPILERASKHVDMDITYYSSKDLSSDDDCLDKLISEMNDSDIILLYRSSTDFWDKLEDRINLIKNNKKIVCFGSDPTHWSLTSVDHEIAITAFQYASNSGEENFIRLFNFLGNKLCGMQVEVLPPVELPWQGIIHPDCPGTVFSRTTDYMQWYGKDRTQPWVGIIASRPVWAMDGCAVECNLLRDLENLGINVILIFTTFSKDISKGALSVSEAAEKYFMLDNIPLVNAVVKFTTAFVGGNTYGDDAQASIGGEEILSLLDVPVYQPVVLSRMSVEEWRNSLGLTSDITWQIVFPEFEGIIEPLVIGSDKGYSTIDSDLRIVLEERSRKIAQRVAKQINLQRKSNSEKKVLIFLNNFPCAGVEANIGAAAGLDSLESVSDILKRMKEEGYTVDAPENGKELIELILERKAYSEFRWTTIQEIIKCGGAIHRMPVEEYNDYFKTLPESTQADVINFWGEPPGMGMVFENEIVITGVSFGNVIVAVQPKRGCYGSRCDGEVCKILHDPLCPPTHQFLATYHYFEEIWGADVIIHTGTHGSMEWTPGKGVGMTETCYPDICIGTSPHLYIYNSNNPPEGIVAKRRSYATLIDHLQMTMTRVELYDEYSDLENLLSEYNTACTNPVHSEQLKEQIIALASNLFKELEFNDDIPLKDCVKICHDALSRIRNSQMNLGLHTFGRIPIGDERCEVINSIVRYGEEHDSIRDCVADIMGLDLSTLYADQGEINEKYQTSNGALIEEIGIKTRDIVKLILAGFDTSSAVTSVMTKANDIQISAFGKFIDEIKDIDERLNDSCEMDALLRGLNGRRISPGPAGPITRGRYDILPTGRNFYSMDPFSVPSTTAWKVGMRLADGIIEKYLHESGEIPESIAFFWTMGEIISTGGEMMSQLLYLLGVKPKWGLDGRVKDIEIIPLEELKWPRIDITVNVSCILRDNLMNCIDLIDSAVRAVAELDEPLDKNYVRKHTLESITSGMDADDALTRMFGAPPGSYISGVNLAVFASSWKEDKDLAEIFVKAKGYGYGNSRNGKPMFEQFASSLSRVNVTFDKVSSDEGDILACGGHFSNVGGLTVAARYLSGTDVKAYYGDTRDPRDISVNTLADEIRRVMRTKVLNPAWIEGMKQHGYKGAGDIMKKISRLYGWEASTKEVDDWIFDEVTATFVSDPEMRQFFKDNNPYALEEIARRLLEANSRGLWNTDNDTLQDLQNVYLDLESVLEDLSGDGEYQGGSIDIFTSSDISSWNSNMANASDIVSRVKKNQIKPENTDNKS